MTLRIPFERVAVYTLRRAQSYFRAVGGSYKNETCSFRLQAERSRARCCCSLAAAVSRARHSARPSSCRRSRGRRGTRLRLLVRVPLGAMRDVEFPLRGDGLLDLAARRHGAARCRDAVAGARHRRSTKETRPLRPAARSPPSACRCRPIDPSSRSRRRSRTSPGPPLAGRHDARLEPGAARRAARVSDRVGSLDVLDPSGPGAARRTASSRSCATSRRPARSARSS